MRAKNISLDSYILAKSFATYGIHEPHKSLFAEEKKYYEDKYKLH